jgi:hypothetical protein
VTGAELAAIVARDAMWLPEPNGSFTATVLTGQSPPMHVHTEDAIRDRRDLLDLVAELRDALAEVGECHGCIYEEPEAEALLSMVDGVTAEPVR